MQKNEVNKKVAFITLGCKVNQYETNAMMQSFQESGYEIIDSNEKSDIYIINTCTVTNMSDRKSRQMLRKAKELNSKSFVVACGCYAQVAKEEVEKIEEIDLVIGNNEKTKIVEIIENNIAEKENKILVEDLMNEKEFADFGEVLYTEKTRAVIKIQDGCDKFCSYCIIPYARGRVRSRKAENIISEVTKIAKKGIQEIVITGIHIASYGKDFEDNYGLIDLLEELNKVEGIQRIRIGSLEPLIITEKFVSRLVKLEKLCHHFHLSLQSACNDTLKRMNRKYSIEEFINRVELLRKHYKDVILTTDIIVGFPGETEEEFNITYKNLEKIKFYEMHVFKYSPRKGTRAAVMQNQIDGNIKEARSKKLLEMSNKYKEEYNELLVGKEVEILIEEFKNGTNIGHTQNYIKCKIKSVENLENKLIKIKIEKDVLK